MNPVDSNRSALLVMDCQADIVGRMGAAAAPILARVGEVVAGARKVQLPIIYVVVGFRPGYPEIGPKNASFSAVSQTGRFVVTTPGSDIVDEVAPKGGDIVVVKHRVSAFAGTDLEMILRAKSIDTLVLCGFSTSGVVLSTVRHAADADYTLVVVKDCCGDPDEEVHRVLTEKVLARQATITTSGELIAALASG